MLIPRTLLRGELTKHSRDMLLLRYKVSRLRGKW
jgi:hypothetical protein